MRKFLVALSFYTRLNFNLKDVTEDEFYQSMLLMPFVGLIIGLWLWFVAWIMELLNIPAIGAVFLIFSYLWISGGLHLDGVADTTDGLMSARNRERVLEIMKDSRLGSFGAIALIMLFLLSYGCYSTILPLYIPVIVLAPVVGRFCGLQNCRFANYASGGGGLGKRIVDETKTWHLCVYFALIMIPAVMLIGPIAGIAMIGAMLCASYLLHIFNKGIGGMTGDTIGMTIEVTQAFYLLVSAIIMVNWPALCVGLIR